MIRQRIWSRYPKKNTWFCNITRYLVGVYGVCFCIIVTFYTKGDNNSTISSAMGLIEYQ